MFGHDDNDTKNLTALPTEDSTVTPGDDATAQLPEPAADEGIKPDYIATDRAGKPDASTAPSLSGPARDLLGIKQQALKELTPLVDHLNQTPEEKFRTTMMMIQAADDQSLINRAYDAAKAITDEKTRAQALLDVINEINYFTQQHES
jgi:hypothetical protein